MFDLSKNLKIQTYLDKQNLDTDKLSKIDQIKFNEMYTPEEFSDIKYKVETYKELDKVNKETPTSKE